MGQGSAEQGNGVLLAEMDMAGGKLHRNGIALSRVGVRRGLGRDFVSAITNRDYTMIMGTTILLSSMVIIANVIVDILYKIIDPRIKLK